MSNGYDKNLDLDDDFPSFDLNEEGPDPMASLPQQVTSAQPIVQQTAQVLPQTGLTQTETALLSPEEQIIRQRQRT